MTEQHANIALSEDSGQQECLWYFMQNLSTMRRKREGHEVSSFWLHAYYVQLKCVYNSVLNVKDLQHVMLIH